MTQQVLIAFIGAMGVLATALFTLAGVLYSTKTNFKLGKRTSDIAEKNVDIARQNADGERIAELTAQNKGHRDEIQAQFGELQGLREAAKTQGRAASLADAQHEAEKAGWTAERQALSAKVEALLRQVDLRDTHIGRAEAERDLALEGQICAESGLSATLKTIECIQSNEKEK